MHNNRGNDARHWNLTRDCAESDKKKVTDSSDSRLEKKQKTSRCNSNWLCLNQRTAAHSRTQDLHRRKNRINCVSINELLLAQGHKIYTEVRCASRGTECLSFDVLSPIDSLCIGHFSTLNLEIKHRERHMLSGSPTQTRDTRKHVRNRTNRNHKDAGTWEDTTNNTVS